MVQRDSNFSLSLGLIGLVIRLGLKAVGSTLVDLRGTNSKSIESRDAVNHLLPISHPALFGQDQ